VFDRWTVGVFFAFGCTLKGFVGVIEMRLFYILYNGGKNIHLGYSSKYVRERKITKVKELHILFRNNAIYTTVMN